MIFSDGWTVRIWDEIKGWHEMQKGASPFNFVMAGEVPAVGDYLETLGDITNGFKGAEVFRVVRRVAYGYKRHDDYFTGWYVDVEPVWIDSKAVYGPIYVKDGRCASDLLHHDNSTQFLKVDS